MELALPAKGPQRWVPLSYLAFAHLGLACACVVTLWDSSLIAGFFYHSKMIAVVHTLTLGWISSSLVGVLYIASARLGLRVGRLDIAILVAWCAGASGLVSHFWIEEFNGLTWSAGLLGLAILTAAGRFGMTFAATDLPAGVRLQLNLAWLNLVGTAFIGILIGFNKTSPVLPGYSLHNVFAHAHLAGLGWAFLQAIALGHLFLLLTRRLAASASGLNLVGTILVQAGTAGVFVSLLVGEPYANLFGLVLALGVLSGLAGLVAHARASLPQTTPAAALALGLAATWLIIAAGIGLGSLGGQDGGDPAWIMTYGVAGLLGGLGQSVCGLILFWLGRHGHVRFAVLGWSLATVLLVFGLGTTSGLPIVLGSGVLLLTLGWTSSAIFLTSRAQV
jgi:hypothetical protein